MKKIQTRLNKLSKRQLQEICKRIGIKCPKRKRDIVNKLLQPLGYKYKMEREQKRREREEARKMEREQKRKEREEARELQKKSRDLQRQSRELVREARKMEREKKREERQRLIEKWKQEGKDNVEIVQFIGGG